MGRSADDRPLAGERLWFAADFLAQAKARELGVTSGTVMSWDTVMRTVTLESDDGTVFTVRRDRLRFTAPPGLSQKRATVKAPRPKARKEAIRPECGEELSLLDVEA